MNSPFPGMDPYLERHWGDVHSTIIYLAKQSLQPQLGGDRIARSQERIYIDDDDPLRRQQRVPDVRIVEVGISDVPLQSSGGIAVAEPVVIEILADEDLTRAGTRELLVHEFELPEVKRGEYLVSVYRAASGKHGRREGYGLKLRERLPGIRIPLRAGDADIALDLQSLVDQAYTTGAYGRTLDYNRECDPPLGGDDAAWADQLLRAAGRRG